MPKSTEPLGPIAFSSKLDSKILNLPAPAVGFKQSLEIHRIEVGNSSGADAAAGWGYAWPSEAIKLGDYDTVGPSPKYTERSQDLAAGAIALGTGGGIVVQVPRAFGALGMNVTIVGGAISARKYWNGSSFATFSGTQLETLVPTGTGYSVDLSHYPSDWASLVAADAPVASDGLSAGYFAWLIELAAPVTIDRLEAITMRNYVELVADGNALVDSYEPGIKLPFNSSVVPYLSIANADNWAQIEYSITT